MGRLFASVALAGFVLAGCVSQRVFVDRKVYHTLVGNSQFSGKTYAIEFTSPAQSESLEMQAHARVLASFLGRYGMKEASGGSSSSDYVFRIRFGIGKENSIGGGSNSSSSVSAAGISVMSSTSLYTYTEYTRSFDVTVHEGTKLRAGNRIPIYEGQALSEDSSNDTTRHFPILISALMHDFPSKSGQMERGIEFELW